MMDWDKLRIFHAVATAQSFTRAGEMLNVSQSAISRQVSALEDSLKVALFHRHARGLMLTEQGEILYKTASEMLSRLSAAENALLESKERPRGPLKITTPVAFGTHWLAPHMSEFAELYPDIEVTILADDKELDIIMREADVAIRSYPARHPDLIQKSLATLNNSLYASNEYVRQHGVPKKPHDLHKHRLISYGDAPLPFAEANWALQYLKGKEHPNLFQINSLHGMLKAVEGGLGIAGLPDYMVGNRPHISRILPTLKGPATEIYYVYSMEMRSSKRVNVFKDFIVRKLAEDGLSTVTQL
ncbi:MAG: LysR family transcriptional regulator [Alphaproteobacteria bacterium]